MDSNTRQTTLDSDAFPPEMIPGERDSTTLTHRQPGAIGGQFSGADTPSGDSPVMDEETARLHTIEGGG